MKKEYIRLPLVSAMWCICLQGLVVGISADTRSLMYYTYQSNLLAFLLFTAEIVCMGIYLFKVTRVIRTCLKAVNCGAFRPFSFGGRQPTCSKEEQKSPPISSSLRSEILKSADFCRVKAQNAVHTNVWTRILTQSRRKSTFLKQSSYDSCNLTRRPIEIPAALHAWVAITLFATFFGYHFLLNQMCPPHSLQDAIIHYIVPLGTVGEHLLFHRYGGLKWYHPLLWAVTPLVYYGYVLCMYFADIPFIGGYFPYFFMDHLTNGAGVIALYLAAFYVGMTAAGFAAFGIDRLISSLLHKRKR